MSYIAVKTDFEHTYIRRNFKLIYLMCTIFCAKKIVKCSLVYYPLVIFGYHAKLFSKDASNENVRKRIIAALRSRISLHITFYKLLLHFVAE